MFKNVCAYRITSPWTTTVEQLEAALQPRRFVPCGASQEKAVGWIEPRGHAHGPLVEVVAGQLLLRLSVEVKSVPASVVKRRAQEQIDHIESSTGRKPGKKESREIREDVRQSLLPMAFSKLSSVWVWVDPQAQLLVLDAGSSAKSDEVMTELIKVVDGLAVSLVNTQTAPATAMAHWLSSFDAPRGFTVDRECELKAADESKAVVRYSRHRLDTEEVQQHIASGKMPTRLAMTWDERVSFVLTEALQLKKLAILDVVFEGSDKAAGDRKEDNFDTDVAILTGELRRLIPDLIEALDGEMALGASPG